MYFTPRKLPPEQASQPCGLVFTVLMNAGLLSTLALRSSLALAHLEEVGAVVSSVETPLRLSLQLQGEDPAWLIDSRATSRGDHLARLVVKPRKIADFTVMRPRSGLTLSAQSQVLELSLELILLVSSPGATGSFSGTIQAGLIAAAQAAALVEAPRSVPPSPSSLAEPVARPRGLDTPPTEPVLRRVGELFHVYSSTVGIQLVTDLIFVPIRQETLLAVGVGIDSRLSWPAVGQAQSYGASLLYCTPFQGNQLCFGGFTHLGHLEGPFTSNEMTGLGLFAFTHQ
jgi:hypothetical protein